MLATSLLFETCPEVHGEDDNGEHREVIVEDPEEAHANPEEVDVASMPERDDEEVNEEAASCGKSARPTSNEPRASEEAFPRIPCSDEANEDETSDDEGASLAP